MRLEADGGPCGFVGDLGAGAEDLTRAVQWQSCAVTSAGGVKCWGYNQYGQVKVHVVDLSLCYISVFACSWRRACCC